MRIHIQLHIHPHAPALRPTRTRRSVRETPWRVRSMTAGECEEVCEAWRATFGRFRSHHARVYAHTHTHTRGGGAATARATTPAGAAKAHGAAAAARGSGVR
jgi:hypothetical protein